MSDIVQSSKWLERAKPRDFLAGGLPAHQHLLDFRQPQVKTCATEEANVRRTLSAVASVDIDCDFGSGLRCTSTAVEVGNTVGKTTRTTTEIG
jgi:hypothetical protein